MKEKMPKKSGRWWFWRKSSVKQVFFYENDTFLPYVQHSDSVCDVVISNFAL